MSKAERKGHEVIHLLHAPASSQQIQEMLEAFGNYIKLAVDIRRGVLAGGGVLHADCEAVLLDDGSQQEDIWGADWIPSTREIRYEALINIRPSQNNRLWRSLILLFEPKWIRSFAVC